jgi:hypothetical protein
MDKVLPILEKYVQWIALGLGGLFLAFMAYSYLMQEPVTVKVDGRSVPPGQVDDVVLKSPAVGYLADALKKTGVLVPPPPLPKVQDETLGEVRTVAAVPTINWTPPTQGGAQGDPLAGVTKLPVLPVLVEAAPPAAGRGVFQYPKTVQTPGGGGGAPVTPAAPGGFAPASPIQPGLPAGQPAFGAGGVDVAAFEKVDIDFQVYRLTLKVADLDKAFKAAGLKPSVDLGYKTSFLQVELLRQRKDPIRNVWEPETLVAVPAWNRAMTPELPRATADADAKQAFLDQAKQSVRTIVQPPFAEWVAGDPVPGTMDAGLTPGGGFGPGAMAPGGMPPGGAFVQPGTLPPAAPLAPGGIAPGGVDAAGNPIEVTNPLQPGEIPGESNPDGLFHPGKLLDAHAANNMPAPEVTFIVYDTTMEAGRTYRYRVRYSIRNPLYQYVLPGKEALTSQLAITSAESAWSGEVSTLPRVDFYVRSTGLGTATFDVMLKQNNEDVEKGYTFYPGDVIAGDGWNSGWMVADVRKSPASKGGGTYVIITDGKGRVERREAQKDQSDKALKYQPAVDPNGLLPGPDPAVPGGVPGAMPPGVRPPGALPPGGIPPGTMPPARPPRAPVPGA